MQTNHIMKKTLLSIFVLATLGAFAQNVNIPDANFKSYLVGNSAINTNGDTEIQVTEANSYSGTMDCSNLFISDLTGIEEFTSLTELYCSSNSMNFVDVSGCNSLENLWAAFGVINSIILPASGSLIELHCYNTFVTSVDLSFSPLLEVVDALNSDMTSLDVTNNPNLTQILCAGCSISTLDISNNTLLDIVSFNNNSLATLDISNNPSLTFLSLNNNSIGTLDISNNPNLIEFYCDNNDVTELNVANGNNATLLGMTAINNPNLTCIQVDDVAASSGYQFWMKDAAASYSLSCGFWSPVLVSSIAVQGTGGVSTITNSAGTLQMEADVLPANADDATYTWSVTNGTGTATIDASGLLTAVTDGTVDVIATANDASGITGAATITISNQSTGIEENTIAFHLTPNPTTGIVMIQSDNNIESVKVLNTLGQEVLSLANQSSFDLTNLTNGVYFITVKSKGKSSTKKLIKK
jgi:hypothetical protein